MVPVGQEHLGIRERRVDAGDLIGVAQRPDPLRLVVPVAVDAHRLRARGPADDVADGRRPAVDEQHRGGVELHLAHPVGELASLTGVDGLVRQDGSRVARAGAVRELERPDEPADRDPVDGVLVQVERGLGVVREAARLLPARQSPGHVAIGTGEGPERGGVAHARAGEHHPAEGVEPEGSGDERGRHIGSVGLRGVHPQIVGCPANGPAGATSVEVSVSPTSLSVSREPLQRAHDLLLLDLDGVVYVGGEAVPGAAEALEAARAAGSRVAFVTNNASRSAAMVAEHLTSLGVEAAAPDVVTSAQAAARLLVDQLGAGGRVLALGGDGLADAVREAGLVTVGPDDDPAAVVTGYGPDVRWSELMRVAMLVRDGVPWVASNTDLTFPTPHGRAPGHGVQVRMLAEFAGVEPRVAGKPSRPLLEETLRRTGAARPLMVGDRLDTDIEGADAVSVPSLLVLTGVTGLPELVAARPAERPSYVAPDLAGLGEPHDAPTRHGDGWLLGGWTGATDAGRLSVTGDGATADWWRVAACAAWQHLDETGAAVDRDALPTPPNPPRGSRADR